MEQLPDSPIFIVHAAMLHTGRAPLVGRAARSTSLVWDPTNPADMTNMPLTARTFSAARWLPDGRLVVAGGYVVGTFNHSRATFLFDPAAVRLDAGGG